ncbi:prolyl oligopeptidase family serine peptidase [Mycobacterium paraterrae]|uniref:Prolyl oligopeptidase family serine peptidase n=1 Tax=Mycobacterium paraterrae TaxID=577492 RepID=A0ABY3VHS4_9MYCO|nr:prolyl oligopeptidase family serine peptidase [Mycobacterium paraterrae]UMB68938.1 prolyl oligopeptidase family serine peptidase [Mycobacterium paraterrae]
MNDDPYLWLEDVLGDEQLNWVRNRNDPTVARFGGEEFERMRAEALEVLDTDARIPYVRRRGDYLYNFWRDATNPRGLWQRTTLDSYRSDNVEWDVLIDVDQLARDDDENWVWSGAIVIEPEFDRALVNLSRGGADAVVVREFDVTTRQFVDDGFELPEAKTQISWHDRDTVLVGTDFGPDSLTDSGYPRIVKKWRRGTPLAEAQLVFEGARTDISVSGSTDRTPGFERTFISRATDFWNSDRYELRGEELIRIDVPSDASSVSIHREWLLIEPRTDWEFGTNTYPAGSLLATNYNEFVDGARDLTVIFEPDAHTCLHQYAWTRDRLLLVTLADVASRVETVTPPSRDDPLRPASPRLRSSRGSWERAPLAGIPPATESVIVAADDTGDEFFLDSSGFDSPSRLLRGTGHGPLEQVKAAPAFFDAENLSIAQYFATSKDGTAIPYFVVRPGGVGGPGPTLLYGYGGFENSLTPSYSPVMGRLWLARGGTYVLANIRGGGEYGPRWHTQAMRENRHLVDEDFAAVATDLVDRGITTVPQLGAQGGSNGGLLMGIMLTKYPQLFGALVCQVPLLDMRRFHLLLAGASWVAEYGNPDDADDWQFIAEYSPYQNVSADVKYPPVLITTSTRDDRVHPGHARKMTAALEATGHQVWYYENIEGGHAGAADNAQSAFKTALAFSFLWQILST